MHKYFVHFIALYDYIIYMIIHHMIVYVISQLLNHVISDSVPKMCIMCTRKSGHPVTRIMKDSLAGHQIRGPEKLFHSNYAVK
jgi:hypothetical protein